MGKSHTVSHYGLILWSAPIGLRPSINDYHWLADIRLGQTLGIVRFTLTILIRQSL